MKRYENRRSLAVTHELHTRVARAAATKKLSMVQFVDEVLEKAVTKIIGAKPVVEPNPEVIPFTKVDKFNRHKPAEKMRTE